MYRIMFALGIIFLAFAIPGGTVDGGRYRVSPFQSQSDAAMILAFATVDQLPPAPKPEPAPVPPKPDGDVPAVDPPATEPAQ